MLSLGLLEGKIAAIFNPANKRSIAWGVAQAFQREGATLVLGYQNERLKENVEELAATLPVVPLLVQLDVSSDEEIDAAFHAIRENHGGLDILVHSLAYANREDLEGRFSEVSRTGYALAHDVSAYSLIAMARAARPLMEGRPDPNIMTMTYRAHDRVMQTYGVMATAKAALETAMRYLADDLGPSGIRVNAISAGALKTLAGSAVKGLTGFRHLAEEKAPLRRAITQEEVGDVAVFLASPLARAVTGETIHVDCGFHIVGV